MTRRHMFVGGAALILLVVFYAIGERQQSASTGSFEASSLGAPQYAADASFGVGQEVMALKSGGRSAGMMPSPIEPPGYQTGGGEEFMPENRLIIKIADLSIVVQNVQAAVEAVVGFAESKGGFEVARNVYKEGLGYAGTVTVRIPAALFQTGLDEAKKLGEVRSQSVNGQDVTEEFVDVQAQIKNLRATEDQFREILLRAQKIEDILAVQRELSNVRSQIDRLEGRKKYLEQSASLSTLTVHFSTDPETLPVLDDEEKWKPLGTIKEAVRSLVMQAQNIVDGIIWLVIYIPFWLVIGLVLLLGRRWYKKYQTSKRS